MEIPFLSALQNVLDAWVQVQCMHTPTGFLSLSHIAFLSLSLTPTTSAFLSFSPLLSAAALHYPHCSPMRVPALQLNALKPNPICSLRTHCVPQHI